MELWKREFIRIWKQTLMYRKKVYLLLTPEHGNYGDHAIAMAEVLFLKKVLPGYHIIEIQADVLNKNVKRFRFFFKPAITNYYRRWFLGYIMAA